MEGQVRIYVGGLGERVTEDDLRKTFSNLGSVESVDIIRTKGRSFAYINFLPSSQNSLPKLFSMYNGCSWKGGKLKLEKAKEHYVDRLKREWAEDAALENDESIDHSKADENTVASVEPKSNLDLEKGQIHIFFPKLRKIKSLPLRGTGKHKYSFQRVPVPSLPVHMCDCCLKDSDPVQNPREKSLNAAIQDQGINEEEINVMNSVMNKLLNRETCSSSKPSRLPRETQVQDSEMHDNAVTEEEINLMDSVMNKVFNKRSSSRTEHNNKGSQDHSQQSDPITNLPVDSETDDDDIEINLATGQDDAAFLESWGSQTNLPGDNETDHETDDDDIKINLATGKNDAAFPESWGSQANLVNETRRSNEQPTIDGLATASKRGKPEKKVKISNKRKSVSDKDLASSPMPRKKARLQTQSDKSEEEEPVENLKSVTKTETKRSGTNDPQSQKSALKEEQVGDGTSSLFSRPQVTSGGLSNDEEKKPKDQGGPTGQNSGVDKPTKGSSWVQKSSWTQLVGGQSSTTSSSFSISQILPIDTMLKKQDPPKPISFSNTTTTTIKEPRTSQTGSDGPKPSLGPFSQKKDAQVRTSKEVGPSSSKAPRDDMNHPSDQTMEKKPRSQPKQGSSSLPIIGLGVRLSSETCPFMRTADSSSKERMAAKSNTPGPENRNEN